MLEQHRPFNVRVDLNGIGAFGRAPAADGGTVLFADLQTNFGRHARGRLGSGRAGFYRGHYLKGVGRTPLAANWNSPDRFHNSGHLAASSAIREYVASCYLAAHGLEETIVPCEGVLLAELDECMRPAEDAEHAAPVDSHLQAISIKQGDFARFSNLTWLLHHLTPIRVEEDNSLAVLAEMYCAGLLAPSQLHAPASEIYPARLASLQAAAIDRALRNFEAWFSLGIWWGSFTNNLTLDGRFLDLETPGVAGGGVFGVLVPCGQTGNIVHSGIIGAEVLGYLAQVRAFLIHMCALLESLPGWFDPLEREFAAELAFETRSQLLVGETVLASRDCAVDRLLSIIACHTRPLSPSESSAVRELLESEWTDRLGPTGAAIIAPVRTQSRMRFFEIACLPAVVPEPGFRARYNAFGTDAESLLHAPPEELRKGVAIAAMTQELDDCTAMDQLLGRLTAVKSILEELRTPALC